MRLFSITATLSILFISLFMGAALQAADCDSDAPPNAQEAYDFGLEIQELLLEKDIQGLFNLIDGELGNGPRKSYVATKTFDEIFDASWVEKTLLQTPDCEPVGWRGYMLGNGTIWYEKFGDEWKIFGINGANEEEETITSPGWHVGGKLLHPVCFAHSYASGDNFEEFADIYEIENIDELFINPGQYYGNEIDDYTPIKPSWCDDECGNIALVHQVNQCTADNFEHESENGYISITVEEHGYPVEYDYNMIAVADTQLCSTLAPDIGTDCVEAYLVEVGDYSGGSIGWNTHYGIYGLFDLPQEGLTIAPLRFFPTKNDALNYLDNH